MTPEYLAELYAVGLYIGLIFGLFIIAALTN